MLEAEKDTLVLRVSDLRQLLRKVKEDGEDRLAHIKNKNVRHLTNPHLLPYRLFLRRRFQT